MKFVLKICLWLSVEVGLVVMMSASKELFETLCKKLRTYEDEYQAKLRRHLEETFRKRSQEEESKFTRFRRWTSDLGNWLLGRIEKSEESEENLIRYEERPSKKQLRRTYSAIPAQEYEKEELINMHLLPATPKPSSSYVKESASLFNLRRPENSK